MGNRTELCGVSELNAHPMYAWWLTDRQVWPLPCNHPTASIPTRAHPCTESMRCSLAPESCALMGMSRARLCAGGECTRAELQLVRQLHLNVHCMLVCTSTEAVELRHSAITSVLELQLFNTRPRTVCAMLLDQCAVAWQASTLTLGTLHACTGAAGVCTATTGCWDVDRGTWPIRDQRAHR